MDTLLRLKTLKTISCSDGTYPFRPKRCHPGVGHWGYKRFWLFWLFSLICQKARVRGVGRHFFRLSPGGYSLRASSPILARKASFSKTRERGAEERLRRSLARSRETRFARPKSRACSQAKEVKGSILIHYTFLKCAFWTHGTHVTCTFLYPLLCTVMIFAFSVFCLAIVSATSSLLKKPKRDRWPRMDFLSDYCCATELFISGILYDLLYSYIPFF